MEDEPIPIEELLTTDEVANMLRIDEVTLKRWRMDVRGPRWVKLGDSPNSPVRYTRTAVVDYINSLTDCGPRP